MRDPIKITPSKLFRVTFLVAVASIALFAQGAPSITGLSPASAAVGAPVLITGADFGSTPESGTVTFNGVMADPSSWSATTIKVSVPSGATTGKVVMTVNGQVSNPTDFTVK